MLRALAKDPNERYQSADEFREDLDRLEAGIPVSPETTAAATAVLAGATAATQVLSPDGTPVAPPPTAPARHPPAYPPDYGYSGPPRRKRRRWVPWLLVALFLAAAALAGWYVFSRIQDELEDSRPVAVPEVVGLDRELAVQRLEERGFEVEVEQEASAEFDAGKIARQEPRGGTEVAKGQTVTIWESTGPPKTTVPALVGLTYNEALDALNGRELDAKRTEVFSNRPVGEVVAQNPKPNTTVREGSVVTLQVSKGAELVTVPDVLQQSRSSAQGELQEAGFKVRVQEAPSDDVEAGLVSEQDPEPGVEAQKGSTVTIVLSTGPETRTVPSVLGQDSEVAIGTLQGAGFDVEVIEEETLDPANENRVLGQEPGGGSEAEPGSTVTITVGRFSLGRTGGDGDEDGGGGP